MKLISPSAVTRAARAAFPALLLAASLSTASAQQQTLVNWDQQWSWMHPMGAIPPRPAGGADTDFTTTWYLKQSEFVTQYDGPLFGASLIGSAATTTSYDSGTGPGPVAYGDFQYTTTPLPAAPAEFPGVATYLTTPLTNNRHTGYFRTTFTVPNDGRSYQNPVLRYILDDGGFVYLDGVPILRVNMTAGVTDAYTQITAGKADTESAIRTAELYGPVGGTATGGNNLTTPVIVGNAYVLASVPSLAPGEHTLAISVHNEGVTSSDIGLAVQLTADASDCVIAATGTPAVRSLEGDAENLTNDTVSFDVTVTGAGVLSPSGWVVSGPAGSSLIGQTGAYGTARHFTGVPVAEFPPPGGLVLEVQDAATATCKATVSFQAPQRIGSVNAGPVSGLVLNKVPWIPTWVIDETAGTLTLNNPGAGADRIIESLPIDLSGIGGDVRFSADLEITDTSSGMEIADTFVAELEITLAGGTTALNLISRYDTDGSGRMNGGAGAAEDEFNAAHTQDGNYTSTFPLTAIIPKAFSSAALVLRGVNDSPSETFTVKNVRFEKAVHSIEIQPSAPPRLDNRGTPDPADDVFSLYVSVTAASLPPGSEGWTSDSTPASGFYSPQPVLFGPFPVSAGVQTITLRDNPVTTVVSNTLTVSPPGPPTLTAVLTTGSVNRIPNGPGLADDTVAFEVLVTGAHGGPGYSTAAAGAAIQPAGGVYSAAPVSITLSAVPASGIVSVAFTDVSYPAATATLDITVPVVSVIGATDFGAGASELLTSSSSVPAAEWVIDSNARTLTMATGGTGDKVVESAVLDLSTVGAVSFTAKFRAYETSAGSNFENTDKFKAELVIDGVTVNLISQWDIGNGSFGSLGPNGAPDDYLNGYKGEGATNALVTADYNLYPDRDEFNRLVQSAEMLIDNTFDLAATIPADANSVQLKIYGTGVNGSEFFVVSDISFTGATNDPDSDSDGIPDSVEIAAGLNPSNASDAALDLDGDGQSNLAEYRAGTSITNAASNLHMTGLTRSGDSVALRWSSVAGKSYRIQSSATLAGPWSTLPGSFTGSPETAPGPDFGTQTGTVTLPAPAAGKHFLRVVIP